MPRKSLRPHLNQIRAWVRQGRTDAWVAHQLEVSVRDIEQFKRQNELVSDEEAAEGAAARRLPRGDRPARRGRRADRRRARGRRSRGRAPRRGGSSPSEPTRTTTSDGRRATSGTPHPQTPSQPARRPRTALRGAQHRPARGHLRPRRGGLRPVARPRHPGQPDLRRALGRPPPVEVDGRGGPHRHPPHGRRRARSDD